jgi:hypothetical protein
MSTARLPYAEASSPRFYEDPSQRPSYRKIDGRTYRSMGPGGLNQKQAQNHAEALRTRGLNARVIKTKSGYRVYSASSKKLIRAYNAHVAGHDDVITRRIKRADGLIPSSGGATTKKKKRSWWARLTQPADRVSIRTPTRQEELDLREEEDYERIRKELIKAGKSNEEATSIAVKNASKIRERLEQIDKEAKEAKALEKKIRQQRAIVEQERYKQALKDYNEPVPISTVVKYNSLELASGTTTAIGGGILAATTALAAWPLIPLSFLGGVFIAKGIRSNAGNIGLKGGVNNTLDAVEGTIEKSIHAVRTSKDNEEYPSRGTIWSLGLIRVPKKVKPVDPSGSKKKKKRKRR